MVDETPSDEAPPPPRDDAPAAPHDGAQHEEDTAAPAGVAASPGAGEESEALTPGGYAYVVVGEDDAGTKAAPPPLSVPGSGRSISPLLLVAAAIVPAIVVGLVVWFIAASTGGGENDRVNADAGNLVNALFSQSQGGASTRYEGKLAPGYPADLPNYPGARLLSSILQTQGEDASYLVIYDAKASRQTVSAYFEDRFAADPWQIDAAQDGRDSTLHQFSKIDDANIRGLVLAAESDQDKVTTIVISVQVTSGAKASGPPAYDPGVAKTLPEGFPDGVPQYPDATLIESAYQKQASGRTFIVSFVTRDDISAVVDYYRKRLTDGGLTVSDGDTSQSTLENAEAVAFTDAKQTLGGQVTVGTLAEDGSYTRIDVQVRAAKKSS